MREQLSYWEVEDQKLGLSIEYALLAVDYNNSEYHLATITSCNTVVRFPPKRTSVQILNNGLMQTHPKYTKMCFFMILQK